jgi:hypothetical protein
MAKTAIKKWYPFGDESRFIYELYSKVLEEPILVFSDNLKDFRAEWLEIDEQAVIYLQSEVDLLRIAKLPKDARRNFHEQKKLVMERLMVSVSFDSI